MTRILLVDDLTLICEILQTRLEVEQDFQVVGQANNGQAAIEQVEALQPDVVVMDLEMPKMDGLTATQIISDRFPQTRIIILSANEQANSLAKALQAGARGYLLKNSQAAELINTIRFINQGNNQIAPKLLQDIILTKLALEETSSQQSLPQIFSTKKLNNQSFHTNENTIDLSVSTKVDRQSSRLIWSSVIVLILGFFLLLNSKFNFLGLSLLSNASENKELGNKEANSSRLEIENALPVKTAVVNPVTSYQESRFYTGTIEPSRTSKLGFESSGQIIAIAVKEGDIVQAGEPLAYLDLRELEATKAELQAQRSQADAKLQEMLAGSRKETIAAAQAVVRELNQQLELARTKNERRQNLYTEGAISREQLDETQNNQFVLQARLDKAKSELNQLLVGTRPEVVAAQKFSLQQIEASLAKLKIQQSKNVLQAPYQAIVARRLVDEGTVVNANQPILHLVENKALEARIGIPVNVANQIPVGSKQQLQIGEKTYQAKVTAFLPELDSSTRTVVAVLTLERGINKEIFPGQIVRLKLSVNIPTSGYWLPTTALIEGGRGLWFCYALGKVAKTETFYVERRDVEVLYTESERVLVRGTLQPGDRIVLSGTYRIVPEQLVRPVNN